MSKNWPYSNYSKIDADVRRYFPFKNPRPHQLETISEIKHAIESGYKYIVLEAGTGIGKSVMAATLASIYGSTYILTVTKQLQDQYLHDFRDLGFRVVKGRANFTCKKYLEDKIEQSCDEGRCIIEGYSCEYSIKRNPDQSLSSSTICPYEYQKVRAKSSEVVIANYPYMFLELNFNQDFNHRKLLICDEAHNLENTVMNQLKLEFTQRELKEYIKIKLDKKLGNHLSEGSYKEWISFIENALEKYTEEYKRIKNIKKNKMLNKRKIYIYRRINECKRFIYQISKNPGKWICDYNPRFRNLEFKPLKVDKYAKRNLFNHADICLFMSATILDYELFGKWLGIDKNEIYAIRQKSPFKIDRNPIKTYDGMDMSFNTLKYNAPDTLPVIKKILMTHKDDKGIIHTISHKCKDYLVKNLKNDRLIDHNTQNRSSQLDKFKKSNKPLVLISPSMNEGVDLPGNQCRFQIIYKIPFPSLGDKQTRMRKDMESSWYDYKTALALVQTYGRGMRYERDYCKTYFIDSRLESFVKRDEKENNFLPDSFKKAINIKPAVIPPEDMNYTPKPQKTPTVKPQKTPTSESKPKKEPVIDPPESTDTPQDMTEKKKELIKRGKNLFYSGRLLHAIDFYKSLISNELFENDYHPYRQLAKIYKKDGQPQNEVGIITRFFKSGIYCHDKQYRWFKRRLKQLSKSGDYDFSMVSELEDEYLKNGAKKQHLEDVPVPAAYKLKDEKPAQNPTDQNPLFNSSNDKLKDKKELIKIGEDYIKNGNYVKAIDFYNVLMKNELFKNDYYPYRQLAKIYKKNKQHNMEVHAIIRFFKSGIYCDDKQFRWFKRRLKQLSKHGAYDFSKITELENEFLNNGAKNKHLADTPVLSTEKIKEM